MYEVYVCKLNDEVLYVGQGKLGRHNHCKSGCSHVYELNKLHFSGVSPTVDVIYIKTKEEALKRENDLIDRFRPLYNKTGVYADKYVKADIRRRFKDTFINYIKQTKSTKTLSERLIKCLGEFMDYHSFSLIEKEGLVLRSRGTYNKLGLSSLGTLVARLYYDDNKYLSTSHIFAEILILTYFDIYGGVPTIKFIQNGSEYSFFDKDDLFFDYQSA